MGFEPNKITREHIFKAIKRIKDQKIELIASTKYDVIIDGNTYPPKDLLRFAHEEMNGENSWENSGGEPTNKYLVNLGFEVKPKNDPILDLIQKYKSYISNTKMQDEVYKWELVKKFRGRPDTNAEDFALEMKSIKFQNLLYAMSIAVTNHIAKDAPEEYRKLFSSLFDEETPLNDRINSFNVESLKLYRSIGGELGHHQDERSIATYLTLHNPEKYTFYKSTFYKEFCKLMGVSPAGKNEKYGHYLELINQFIENYIVPDTELTNTVKSYIPEYYDGKNNMLLAQDILYCMLNKNKEVKELKELDLIPEILEAIESESFQNIIDDDDFYFEKAKNAFHEFKSLQLSDPSILEKIEQDFKVGGKFKDYYKGLNQDSEEYTITNSIAKLISYCDSNAAFKNELNETRDKRVLAKAGVRQNNWFENLIKFKREENYTELPSSIKNALIYLENPNQGITMLSDNHREKFIKAFVPSKQFIADNFIDDILDFFKPYEIRCKNELNYTRALSAILYNYQPVRNLWLDIVEENDQNLNLNYWVFQGNPKVYDFETAIRENLLEDWTVSSHKEKIKKGDKVILWISGKKAGCYALAEITSEPYLKESSLDDHLFSNQEKSELKADLKITHNLIDNPIIKDDIVNIKELSELKVGNQGTNFVATKEEYDKILELLKNKTAMKYWLYAPGENANMWDEFYEKGVMGLGWDELGDLNEYANKQEISLKLQEIHNTDSSKANDSTANYDFKENVSIGDMIIAKKGRNAYLGYGYVSSDYYYDQSAESYKHRRKVRWEKYGHWDTNHSIVLKTLTDITNVKSKFNPSLMAPEAILNIINGIQSDKKNQMPINQILYGPPGTGKTFKLKDQYFPMYTTKETSLSSEQHFKNVVSECSWWQVVALALLELRVSSKVADIMNNRWVMRKSEISDSKNIRAIMWSSLQSHTIQNSETVGVKQRQSPYIFNKKDASNWEILENEVRDQIPELYEILESVNNFNPSSEKEIQRYVFTTFHQSYSYEDFIEGIKPIMIDGEEDGNVGYRIEDGVFKQLCKKAALDPENRYAIFIDEINRGNVSAIFGELITLIEQDKRKGAANEMTVILPYSKKPFSVPQNLDIIGTMNTADRSVESLDTALRRRFSFVEMLPKPELLKDKGENNGGEIGGIDLFSLLTIINERIEVLVDRDHTIGHAFFINDITIQELRNTFANKIIPLLQEYFYGDYSKMELVIGSAFFEKKEVSKVKFAVKSEDFEAEGQVYHIKNISDITVMSDEDFIKALNQLIGEED